MRKLSLIFVIFFSSSSSSPAEQISFNKHIRPILADRCFVCHGPDATTREAGLRFDREESAKQPSVDSGETAIVPGQPEMSELLRRLSASDDLQMPPPDSNLSVTQDEIELIRRWIAEGAKWERHWSLISPVKAEAPAVANLSWPVNSIDHFILRRLEVEGLEPTRQASKAQWLRRVSFDLTGLPPTLEELDDFLSDESEDAYGEAADRLLESRSFGERMAQEWLDVARYGDTDGLFEDHPRSIYPWRDWVVDAFNENLAYRDFIIWQIAGDLLPEASIEQQVATGFLRNNPTSNEGGIIDEDYRVKYLVDRVNTTATAMMGLTLECAQCHDHKYDPMTQREYYQFAGFFNNLVGNGNTKGATAPTLRRFDEEQAARLPVIAGELAEIESALKSTPEALLEDYDAWVEMLEQPVQWVDPVKIVQANTRLSEEWLVSVDPPATEESETSNRPKMKGRFVRLELPKDHDGFLTLSEVQVFSGGRNIARTGQATQSSVDYNSPAAKAIDGNHDGSFASCSCTQSERAAWWELDLGAEFPIDSVAVWNRTDCCPERLDKLSIQVLDDQRQATGTRVLEKAQARNALPADAVDAEPETREFSVDLALNEESGLDSVAALQLVGKSPAVVELSGLELVDSDSTSEPVEVMFAGDKTLKLVGVPVLIGLENAIVLAEGQKLRLKLTGSGFEGIRISITSNPTAATRASLPKEAAKRLEHFRGQWSGFDETRQRQAQLQEEKKQIEATAPLTMIASDMSSPRENYLLMRGEYDQRGEVVPTAAPASIMPYSEDLPESRLGLAQWLTDPKHPLTARVAVNRYWQMLFGRGIVKTSEDFGTQGESPSHPELLDYLAVDFVESGWNVKRLLRLMVLSATYRQASVRSKGSGQIDPENHLLARGPRRRLPAEFVRDHALSISGLLKEKHGGPGVNPYQPAELFGANAIGSSNARFAQSTGDDLYRRSLYAYWKRQIPAANMRILGADGRTTCRTRREKTNTPLQALVLLNDPQFVEASRVFAERIMNEGGDSPSQRLSYAFRLATSRHIQPMELEILLQEYNDRIREFQADEVLTASYLAGGGQHTPKQGTDLSQLAAYAAVCSLILNLDESISSS